MKAVIVYMQRESFIGFAGGLESAYGFTPCEIIVHGTTAVTMAL